MKTQVFFAGLAYIFIPALVFSQQPQQGRINSIPVGEETVKNILATNINSFTNFIHIFSKRGEWTKWFSFVAAPPYAHFKVESASQMENYFVETWETLLFSYPNFYDYVSERRRFRIAWIYCNISERSSIIIAKSDDDNTNRLGYDFLASKGFTREEGLPIVQEEYDYFRKEAWFKYRVPIYAPTVKWVKCKKIVEDTSSVIFTEERENGGVEPEYRARIGDGYIYLPASLLRGLRPWENNPLLPVERVFITLYYNEEKTDWDQFEITSGGRKVASSSGTPPLLNISRMAYQNRFRVSLLGCQPNKEYGFQISNDLKFTNFEELVVVSDEHGIAFINLFVEKWRVALSSSTHTVWEPEKYQDYRDTKQVFVRATDNPFPTSRRVSFRSLSN